MKYLAVLGRQPKISLAELMSLYCDVRPIGMGLAEFETKTAGAPADVRRLGGSLKVAEEITMPIMEFLKSLPSEGKITLGVSDYSKNASAFRAQGEALKLKRILTKSGRSVRVVPNKDAAISTATSFHNHLFTETKIELIKVGKAFYRVIGVQNIDAYAKRDQARPARDAKVGMLPPKLAQILINLCGDLPEGSRLLDPFCGTGVVLQEAALMGYRPYGTDLNERMVEYSKRNLEWLSEQLHSFSMSVSLSESNPLRGRDSDPAQPQNTSKKERSCSSESMQDSVNTNRSLRSVQPLNTPPFADFQATQGDATSYQWRPPIDAVACETYLGQPMSLPPAEIKLKQEKQNCKAIILGFLKNLAAQIDPGTPVTIAVPAWLRSNGAYERLNILDEIRNLGYNVKSFRNLGQEDLLYHRDGQVVAREIIALRKK